MKSSNPARAAAHSAQQRLLDWLINDACPLWSTCGVDRVLGGFHERLSGTEGLLEPRRARVQPRQVAAFAGAAALGWQGDAGELTAHGFNYFFAHYRRCDGLFRTLISPEGAKLDDRALLYDQAFALLGMAEGQESLASLTAAAPTSQPEEGAASMLLSAVELATEAIALRSSMYLLLKRDGAGFETGLPLGQPLASNPHMHLLEASMAWCQISDDPQWRTIADEIVALALSRLIDSETGAMREYFTATWSPLLGHDAVAAESNAKGRIIEPGHQFEWAWLLLRWAREPGTVAHREALSLSRPATEGSLITAAERAAFHLIQIGESHGVKDNFAINALLDDYTISDASARLWPQTERLKVAALAARTTGDPRYWAMAASAANALLCYLDTEVKGSWYDRRTPEGEFLEEPAPASTFYHIVAAIKEFSAAIDATS